MVKTKSQNVDDDDDESVVSGQRGNPHSQLSVH